MSALRLRLLALWADLRRKEELPRSSGEARSRALWLWMLALVIAKVALVANEEIIAHYKPHDDLWYLLAARRFYWFGDYQWDSLLHLPVYPLFVELTRLIGVPLRLATELAYCGAACLLVLALRRAGISAVVAGLAGLAAMFHPTSYTVPNYVGPEILLAPLMVMGVAMSLLWWSARDRQGSGWRAARAAIWWALAWNVRKESILVVGFLVFFAAVIALADRRQGGKVARRVVLGAVVPLVAGAGLSLAIQTANLARWGLFTTSILTSPGYAAGYRALQSIPPATPLDFVPAPVEVRERAYAVSPAFSELRQFLEGDIGKGWVGLSGGFLADTLGPEAARREMGAGQFYWALHDAVLAAGHGNTPAEEDRFFALVAAEIGRAQAEGRLARRWVPATFLDPALGRWLPKLPHSIASVARCLVAPTGRPAQSFVQQAVYGEIFDRMANRRTYQTHPEEGLRGWIHSSGAPIHALSLVAADGRPLAQANLWHTAPEGTYGRFDLVLPAAVWTSQASALSIELTGAASVSLPLREFVAGKSFATARGEPDVQIDLQLEEHPTSRRPATTKVQDALSRGYLKTMGILDWALLLLPLAPLISFLRKTPPPAGTIVPWLLAFVVAERVLFFAILDASSWSGGQARYLYPVMPLHGALVVTAIARIAGGLLPRRTG